MVDVAQLVRVADCGSEGRGFESHLPPEQYKRRKEMSQSGIFLFLYPWRKLVCGQEGVKTKEVV